MADHRVIHARPGKLVPKYDASRNAVGKIWRVVQWVITKLPFVLHFGYGCLADVAPTPATHANLTQLKAGETLYRADKLPKTFQNTLRMT